MVNLEKFKQSLGEATETLADTEVKQLLEEEYKLVELAFNFWAESSALEKQLVVEKVSS